MHDVIIVAVPLIVLLAGILFSRNDVKDMRAEMKAAHKDLRGELHATRDELRASIQSLRAEGNARHGEMLTRHTEVLTHLSSIAGDLRQFYHLSGKLEGRVEAIEKR